MLMTAVHNLGGKCHFFQKSDIQGFCSKPSLYYSKLIIINYYLLLKTLEITNSSCKMNQKHIGRAPADHRPAIKR